MTNPNDPADEIEGLRKLLAECQEYVSDAHAAQLREAKGYDLHAVRAALEKEGLLP